MSQCKAFRVDYYPRDAFMDYCQLEAEEIGVLTQIINLIYSHNGPIDNDAKFIGRTCNITKAKSRRIIDSLIDKEHLFVTAEGKIYKNRCERELKTIEERRERHSRNGKKGSESRWGSELKQAVNNSQADVNHIANTSTITSLTPKNSTHTRYSIEKYLKDSDRQTFRTKLRGEDIYYYIGEFDSEINEGKRSPPEHFPARAFIAWSVKYKANRE